jgi:hypothetical protein
MDPGDVTWQDLKEHGEGEWALIGPSSQGGTTLYRYRGQLYTVGYGEYSSLPGGAEQVIGWRPDEDTTGFPPALEHGHVAGCRHEPHWGTDRWQHRTALLRIERGTVQLHQRAREVWSCSAEEFGRADSREAADVLRLLGPAVLDEALRCAARAGRDDERGP